jgi:protein phosphatase
MAGGTDRGRCRQKNEDAWLCDPALGLAVVADGLGGHVAGEVASAFVVEGIRERLTRERIDGILGGDAQAVAVELSSCLRQINRTLLTQGTTRHQWWGMGSTVVLALRDGNTLHLVHLGDSRAYLLRPGEAHCLTCDHSEVAELVAAGDCSEVEAADHPLRNRLTACLGMAPFTPPSYAQLTVAPVERILLCSDGLWNMLPAARLAELAFVSDHLPDVVQALITAANDAGGLDNITVVVMRVDDSLNQVTRA